MSVSTADFWKLVTDSRLLTPEQCQKLAADFAQVKGTTEQTSAKVLVEWLVSRNALSRYQAMVLMAGRAGPFYYGDYRVYDRVEQAAWKGQFRAIHAPTGHPVMLRFLTGPVTKDPHLWASTAGHVVRQAELVYPLVQRYFEPVDLQAFKFVASEDLRGETLDEVLAKAGRLHPVEACRIIRLAAYGLAALHQAGIVHGDIRPQNLLLEPTGNIKLLIDPTLMLGPINIAQVDPASVEALRADYLAPEFLQAGKLPDALTDIYALGATLFQLLTGQPPFPGGTPGQKLARHAAERIQPLEPYGIPPQLTQIVAFQMAKNPASRFQQASVVGEQLMPFVDPAHAQITAAAPAPTLASYEGWIKQKQSVLAQAAVETPAREPAFPQVDLGRVTTPTSADGTISVATARKPVAAPVRRKPKNKLLPYLTIGGGGAALLILIVALMMIAGNEDADSLAKNETDKPAMQDPVVPPVSTDTKPGMDQKQPTDPPGGEKKGPPVSPDNKNKTPTPPGPLPQTPVASTEVLPDDGKLLWASPTSGPELTLDYVPPDARILLALRPSDILKTPDGAAVLSALGEQFSAQRAAWEKAAGVKLEQVEQLVIALHDNMGQVPLASYRVTLKEPIPEADLVAAWGNPAKEDADGTPFFAGGANAYFVPSEAGGKVFVMGTPAHIKEAAEAKGAPPVVQREINQLRRLSDADRHFTLILSPKYLFGDGQELLSGPYQKLRGPLEWLIGDDVKATMTSLQFGDTFYAEVRMIADIERRGALAGELQSRLEQVPGFVEKYIVSLNAPEYWRMVAFRYPGWIRYLHRNTRVGLEDDVAIMNAVAPGSAAHNLVFGGELAVMSTPGASVASAGPGPGQPAGPKNITELLQRKMTFEVPRNDMNLVMADLEKEVKSDLPGLPFDFGIKIIGDDLMLEGITRNQAIVNFKMENASLEDILTGLVRKANPVPTVQDPSEVDQKLVWLVGPDPEKADRQVVIITTRAAAGKKMLALPPVFVAKKS